MAQTNHFHTTLNRILAFDFRKGNLASRANFRLFREYLRRGVLWSDETDWPDNWKFGDHAYCVDPSVRAPDDAVDQVKQHIVVWGKNAPVQRTCVNALHWAALKDVMDLEAAYGLPDPYEPLLVQYDRGMDFYMENGICFIGIFSVSLWHKEAFRGIKPLLTLDKETLDAIDKHA